MREMLQFLDYGKRGKSTIKVLLTFLLCIAILSPWQATAQDSKEIKGVIKDTQDQIPLPGVNIMIKGTTSGTVTAADGTFTLNVPGDDAVLILSYIGYEEKEVRVGTQTELEISITESIQSLGEVIVVGYGTQKRGDVTGSITSVDSKELQKFSSNDISHMLQGRAAGVAVTNDGQPGAMPNVRIRGISTFGAGQPLYVVDGVPLETPVRDFNPNDVESIEILKDASAGAIYGSRAANGVILITTKQGKKNTPLQIEYGSYYGVDHVWQRMPVLGRERYQIITNEVQLNGNQPLVPANDPNSPVYINDINTDWQAEGLKLGYRHNQNLNFSGGGEYTTYNASIDYFDNDGTLVGNGPDYQRYSFRINTLSEKGRFRVGQNIYYAHSYENNLTFRDDVLLGGRPPLIGDLVLAVPTQRVLDPNNLGGFGGTRSTIERAISLNVIGANSLFESFNTVDRILANGFGELKIIDQPNHSLDYKINMAYDRTNTRDFQFHPEFDLGFFFNSDIARLDDGGRILSTGLVENTLNYKGTFDRHSLDVLAGQMYQENAFIFRSGFSEGFSTPYFPVLDNGQNKQASGNEQRNTILSYLGRVNYGFDDRYLITATIRRDGSSRFAPVNRWGNFPSIAAGWKVHNDFALPSFVSDLKVRASWGQLGNQNIGNYLFIPTINPNILYNFNGNPVTGGLQTNLVSETIRWETQTTFNIGFDAALFDGRFDISLEYYNAVTSDLLVGVPIPASTGSVNLAPTVNAGSLRNSGIEMMATYRKIVGEFTFDITGNLTTLSNEVLALGGNEEPIFGPGSRTIVGEEIGHHFGHVADGIFQSQEEVEAHAFQNAQTAPGDVRFRDLNDDGVIDFENDRTILGSALPSLYYGLNISARYKNWDFTIFMSGMGDYLINSRTYRDLMATQEFGNRHEDILQRWTPDNPSEVYPRVVAGDPNLNVRDSDREGWLQDGTHLRINTLAVGYTLPTEAGLLSFLNSARLYATAQNLFTFQAYKGYNPDFNAGVFSPGFNFGSFPLPRTVMLGTQISF